jgi:hypothetical protein
MKCITCGMSNVAQMRIEPRFWRTVGTPGDYRVLVPGLYPAGTNPPNPPGWTRNALTSLKTSAYPTHPQDHTPSQAQA